MNSRQATHLANAASANMRAWGVKELEASDGPEYISRLTSLTTRLASDIEEVQVWSAKLVDAFEEGRDLAEVLPLIEELSFALSTGMATGYRIAAAVGYHNVAERVDTALKSDIEPFIKW